MKLVIVESPKKARTIAGFLGPGYRVAASMGHVRDLPAKGLGIDVGKDFAPLYEVLPRAGKALAALRKAAAGAEGVLLATDPDREGEAIAWHLVQALRLPRARYQRITFHEISRRAVTAALASPRALDAHLVDAQQARRVLDRLVGYELSPLLWRQVQRGTSAGRVQSVALRLVVDREREIAAFVPREYWTIDVRLRPQGESPQDGPVGAPSGEPSGEPFLARLETVDGRKAEIADEATARLLEAAAAGGPLPGAGAGPGDGHPPAPAPLHHQHPAADGRGPPAPGGEAHHGPGPGPLRGGPGDLHAHGQRLRLGRRRRTPRGA